jgi:uncharacterized protein YbgA (DUF1722 family)/uncharacterized protein YbbK (DUF523 family)
MSEFEKPIVVISKCLGFDACRYNGEVIHDDIIARLTPYIEVRLVCPEVEIGLGTPRQPIRLVAGGSEGHQDNEKRLVQPATERDVSDEMRQFSAQFLSQLGEVDGFILKGRSPSCGLKDVKVYKGIHDNASMGKDSGLFAGEVLKQYGHLAVEEEGRLKNYELRAHFLIKLFTLAHFRAVKKEGSIQQLIAFQSQHKYLFMTYHQQLQKSLGRIVANHEQKPISEVFNDYEQKLYKLLEGPASVKANINVLFHIMGYFSNELTSREKAHFLSLIDKYRANKLPLSSPLGVLRAYIIRFEQNYLWQQSFFEPYPEALVYITDSGKGRDF